MRWRTTPAWIGLWAATVALGAEAAPDEGGGPGDRASELEVGRELYQLACTSCHGAEGQGDGPVGRTLRVPLRPLSAEAYVLDADGDGRPGTAADLRLVLTNGAPAYGGSRLMPPWPQLEESPEDLAALLAYLETFDRR